MRGILAALLLFCATPALADKPWDSVDKSLGAAVLVLHVADWAQTRYIAENPDRFYETNPLLGKHPSKAQVDRFFVLTGVAGYFLADWLEGDGRKFFLGGVAMAKLGVVIHNDSIGIKMEFR